MTAPTTTSPVVWWTQDGPRTTDSGDAVVDLESGPVHVFAHGTHTGDALHAATRATTVRSLVLIDPVLPDAPAGEIDALLRSIGVPTLVIASSAEGTDLDDAQRLAGGITDGVFVVLDTAAPPVHRTRPDSVFEWTTSFTAIADGLGGRSDTGLATPTPFIEGDGR